MRQVLIFHCIFVGILCGGCSINSPQASTAVGHDATSRGTLGNAPPTRAEYAQRAELLYHLLVGEVAGHRGRLQVAVEHYLEAAKLAADANVARRATRLAAYARDYERALRATQRWQALEPDSLDAQQTLAVLYFRTGRKDAAVAQLNHMMRLFEDDPAAGYQRIVALLVQEKDKVGALDLMQRFMEQHGDQAEAHYALASLALQNDALEIALTSADKALALQPAMADAAVLRARVFMLQGETDAALTAMKKVVDAHPKEKKHLIAYGRLLAQAARYNDARKQFEKLLQDSPTDPELLYALGLLALEGRQYTIAEGFLQRLLKTGKRNTDAYFYLGSVAEARDQYDKAIQWFSRVRGGERQVDAKIRVAGILARKGDIEAARRYLFKLHDLEPEQAVRLFIAEIEILRKAKRHDDAMEVANNALAKNPGNHDLYYARSLLSEGLGRIDMAEQDLRKVLQTDPDNAHALNALGYMLADRTDRFQEALGYIQKAIELYPNEPAFVDSMGWVQYRLGNLKEAERYLRRAFQLDQDPEIAAHLGEVLWVMGNRPEAQKVWQRALQSDPDSAVLQKVIKRFQP